MNEPVEIRSDELVQQGLAASRRGDSAAALRLFQEAGELHPASAVPHFLMAAELAQAGDIAAAEGAYANAVLLAPGFDMARFQLGLLQFTSGRVAVALVTWAPLLERPTDQPLQRFVAGFEALGRDDFAQAMVCFRAGLVLETTNEPLKADIRMVMSRIEAISVAQVPVASLQVRAGEPEEDAGTHVLLSNYERQGQVH